ncbi:PriCT-2 domain-containing protein [Zoogloea sp.]|uniref:PriCT-2 domain-containing protein n=1 Tax=Zoogloea sp. TaxID=49181 RepID=UPI00261D9DDA|nr:PriCT-2 domain-containing protein [Zoogloea sp.]MDD3354910.1 PriCT-2 domain-containing protein [Zoogloea sp.]
MGTNEEQNADFRRSILGEGIRFIFTPHNGRHYACTNDAELSATTAREEAEGKTVYFACATYAEPCITGPDGKRRYRVKDNVFQVKAVWLDIDCGADKAAKGAGYRTKQEAAQALKELCKAAGLPSPTWIVDSGNGLHVYWALLEAVSREAWEATTGRFKNLCQTLGFLADPSRTSDAASVLRLPGTMNRKDPANPKPVTIKHKGKPVALEAFDAAVCAALARLGEGKPHEVQGGAEGIEERGIAGTAPAWVKAQGVGSIIEAAPQARPHTLEEVEAALAHIDPSCDRATWFKVLGALAHEFGEAARDLGRRWSAGTLGKGGAA